MPSSRRLPSPLTCPPSRLWRLLSAYSLVPLAIHPSMLHWFRFSLPIQRGYPPVDHGNSIRYNSIGSPTLNISGIQFEMYFMQSRNLLCEWSQLKHTEIGCAIHLFNSTTI